MTIKCYIHKAILPALFLAAGIAFGQESKFKKAEELYQEDKFDSVLTVLSAVNQNSLTLHEKTLFLELRASTYLALDMHDLSFNDYLEVKQNWVSMDSVDQKAATNLNLIEVLSHQRRSKMLAKPFLDEYVAYAAQSGNLDDQATAYSKIAVRHLYTDNIEESIENFDKAINLARQAGDSVKVRNYRFNKGVVFNADSARAYKKALKIFKDLEPIFIQDGQNQYLAYNYNNQAKAYRGLKDYNNAIKFYAKADSVPLETNTIKTKEIFYENMAQTFDEAGDYTRANSYLKLVLFIKDSIGSMNQDVAIVAAENKYRASLREDELRIEKQFSQRNKRIALILGGVIALLSLLSMLIYKNTKRKQRIAEQEKEIEIQKTEKLLKEQELNAIDAMIAGQEKERQRLASDLHDSVGATLSAAKMQFSHLAKNKGQLKNEDELFESTSSLLEEAYKEVRSMAHAKNSGVIAKNGLLPAVQKLAKNASVTKDLTIEVQDFGLEERLDSAMEIAIFRMIQELVTNVIKHAEAKEVTISITQHDDSLNVMVEDNGIGFDSRRLPQREGMGLGSIETRVEHLEGTMEVDSSPGKGTSIIIDIPL